MERILIAHTKKTVCKALNFLLSQEADFQVVSEACDREELFAALSNTQPTIVLIDCKLTDQPMAELIAEIQHCSRSPKVVVLCSSSHEKETILPAGVHKIVDTSEHPRQLVRALRVLQLESNYEYRTDCDDLSSSSRCRYDPESNSGDAQEPRPKPGE